MHQLLDTDEILQDIVALAGNEGRSNGTDATNLRHRYVSFLSRTEPALVDWGDAAFRITSFSSGNTSLRPAFGYSLQDAPWDRPDPAWDLHVLRKAHQAMVGLDPTVARVFDLVTLQVYSPSSPLKPGSGTLYQGNGLMFVNSLPAWTIGDVGEAYTHELTHILLGLDEHRFGHYSSYAKMAEPENFTPTAILQHQKPLHLGFHSSVVAVEVIELRRLMQRHGMSSSLHHPTAELIPTTLAFVRATRGLIERKPHLLLDRRKELLERLERRLESLADVSEL